MTPSSPLGLIAELTHRCPLKCLYCSNPVELTKRTQELETADWLRVIDEAATLGVLQIYLTGGEPCLRADLPQLVRHSADRGLYVNLITSGLGLSEDLCQTLCRLGVDHIQLSLQDMESVAAHRICGVDVAERKVTIAHRIRNSSAAMTINMVIHRENIDRLAELIDFAIELGPEKIEVAHVQFNGWALRNKNVLLPSLSQVQNSIQVLRYAQQKYQGRCRIDFVLPDYYARYPKACMNGWGSQMILVDPRGQALPCHSAASLPDFKLPSVKQTPLAEIWAESELFNAFRGTDWMPEPCRSCERRELDLGGCRCQALALAGSAYQTDPVCHRSPFRQRVDDAIAAAFDSALSDPPPQAAYRGFSQA
ncbi:MAG: pyrroloquinoline quinone biosynthesis protein PqqE [Bdellovibrionales bacterium]